jgi:translocation and assembly module TamB
LSGALQVRSGRSRVGIKGNSAGKQGIDANVELAVASLGDWLPQASGSLAGNFRVRGEWPRLNVAGTANGKSLAFQENRIAALALNATVESPLDPSGKVRATATKVSAAGFEFTRVSVDASGNQAKHEVAVEADGEKLDAAVSVAGGLVQGGWRGELTRLTLGLPGIANLKLRAPSNITVANGSFGITQTCLDDGDSVLCAAGKSEASGALEAGYSFEQVPLALANAIAPDAMPGQLRGEVAGHGGIRRGADGQWLGDVQLSSAAARLVMIDESGDSAALGQRTWLIYENLELRADLRGMDATATLTAALMNGGSLKANLGASNLTAEAPAIEGRIEASFPTLAPFGAFVPTIANLNGAVNADIRLGGTIQAPEITGNVDAQRLQADLGEIGIELRDGRVQAEAKRGGGFVLAASVASGKGHLELAGTMSERGVIDAKILGQNFQAADIPAANVVLTPDLTLTGDPKRYLLRGEVTIPRAAINLQKLPTDQPPGVSPDVVVVRDGKEVEPASAAAGFPIDATILVKLGEQIEIQGYGLDATVTGQLTVRESPGVPTSGSGTLQVSGRYKAYGQDLTIREGRLLFAGTPLDNPRLAIVAMREISDRMSTGLRIAGSAQRPIITVISEPNVGEADALSYLVTGRSLNDVGSASGSSQDALASATRSLEGAGAGLVAKRIGQRLGLDEAGVEENEMIGGSALTIGEYLSPRLYLSYGVGLFEPGEVVALRYKLTDDIGVKVQRGSEETRAGVEYRIEK